MSHLAPLIKKQLSLRDAARLCSITLPDRDGVKFPSPLRPDRNPSCSILKERLIDWTTGEQFDSIALFAEVRGVRTGEAIRQLADHLGLAKSELRSRRQATPKFRTGTAAEIAALAENRGLSIGGLTLASKCGILTFGEYYDTPAWFIGDAERGPMQARRLDGERWPWADQPKALTLKGCTIHRLIGLPLIGTYPHVMICEGGPDLLAAFSWIHELDLIDWCPLGLLGTSAGIVKEEADRIRKRHIRIAAHPDEAGRTAAKKWARQLGGRVEVMHLGNGDLNDLFKLRQGEELFR